jgi:hypothetical protein
VVESQQADCDRERLVVFPKMVPSNHPDLDYVGLFCILKPHGVWNAYI